jgi:Ser/Thr protein kinase RdoA (MazF antagonist)
MELNVEPFPRLSEARAAQILHDGWRVLAAAVRRLPSERDDTFLCATESQTVVLKIAHPDDDASLLDMQSQATSWAQQHDQSLRLPVAVADVHGDQVRQVTGGDGRPRFARVLDYVPGDELDYGRSTASLLGLVGRTAARLSLALVGFEHPADSRPQVWDLRHSSVLEELLDEVEDATARTAAATALEHFQADVLGLLDATPFQAVHGDLNGHNLMLSGPPAERQLGIVDFGDLTRSARVVEVAVTATYATQATVDSDDPWQGARDVVEGFLQLRPLGSPELDLVPDLVLTRLAQKVVLHSWMQRQNPANAAYLGRSLQAATHALTTLMSAPAPMFSPRRPGAST